MLTKYCQLRFLLKDWEGVIYLWAIFFGLFETLERHLLLTYFLRIILDIFIFPVTD